MDGFRDKMRLKSDVQLIRIVTSESEDYQPKALQAAEKKLDNRNLSEEEVQGAIEKS